MFSATSDSVRHAAGMSTSSMGIRIMPLWSTRTASRESSGALATRTSSTSPGPIRYRASAADTWALIAATSSFSFLLATAFETTGACWAMHSLTQKTNSRPVKQVFIMVEANLMIDPFLLPLLLFRDQGKLGVISIRRLHVSVGDSCWTPKGNLSREAAFRNGQDDPRYCGRRMCC